MRHGIKRRHFLKGAGVAGTALVAGCLGGDDGGNGGNGGGNGSGGNGSGGGGGGGGELSVGVLMPLTGDLGTLGQPIANGAELPVTQLESADTSYTINSQTEDTATDPNQGVTAAESLVNAGFPAVTGAASSAVTIQVANQVFVPEGVAMCSPASTSPDITDLEDEGLVYRTPPADNIQGPVLAQVAADEGASTASTIFVNNDYGQLLSETFSEAFESEQDGTVQQTVSLQPGQSSYSSQLQQALGDDPDLLLVIAYPESGIQLFRDFYSGFDTDLPVLVTDGLRDGTLPTEVGNEMANVQGTAPSADGPGRDFFTQRWEEEYDGSPGVFTAQAYDATAVLLLAQAAAGEADGAAIAEQMQTVANPEGEEFTPDQLGDALEAAGAGDEINYQGASSSLEFDDNGDLQTAVYELFAFNPDGGIETVETIEFDG
ncbi:ABC transporter substrate-binding protein [Halomarina ordinaria]|uniref:ABC transporter substrate-binding protein n=1 Tax=Halomarina ordinaria TaxID=3033939 RepID=A0ABD5U4C4_9EURY|nr:ABC transporter substrate-binding protein [Halomarina sp. PSRA2]